MVLGLYWRIPKAILTQRGTLPRNIQQVANSLPTAVSNPKLGQHRDRVRQVTKNRNSNVRTTTETNIAIPKYKVVQI